MESLMTMDRLASYPLLYQGNTLKVGGLWQHMRYHIKAVAQKRV